MHHISQQDLLQHLSSSHLAPAEDAEYLVLPDKLLDVRRDLLGLVVEPWRAADRLTEDAARRTRRGLPGRGLLHHHGLGQAAS